MRYLKTLLVSLLALVGTSAFAQPWTGSEAAAGTFYLYNVGTGKWLCGGNNWGTHASVADYGIDFILAGSNGSFTLDSQLSNGGNSHFLNGEWCDGASMNWTFTQVKTEDGAIAYTIGNGQQFLTANTSDTNVNLKGNEGALSQWILVSKADIAQAALDAKATDVVDVTGFIIGQRTSRNNTRAQVTGDRQLNSNNNVWKMERDADGRWCNFAMNGAGGTGSTAKPYAIEAWNWKSFNFYQDITGVPNGKYTLHVNSFYRGYDGIRGYVYANDAMSPLTAETDAYKSYGVGNDLQNAAAAFFDGKYDNSVDVTVTNGSIRVGVKQMDAPGGDWMPFANFRLEYKGMASLLKNSIDKANELIPTLDEQNAAGLQEAVDAAQAVYDNPDATNAEIQEAIEALEEAYKNFNAVNEAKQLAYDVLTQVPAALYPEDFDWAAERNYKYYKNNEGKYKLASREAVAALIEILDMVENPTEGSEIPADEAAKLLNGLARYIVETHSVGAALGEQGDKGYVDHAYMAEDYEFYHWLLDLFGYPGFDPNYTGHITNPDLADGEEGWENDGFRTLSDQPLSDAEATIFGEEASYTYFDQWSKDGFKADAHQTFQLPAGRYMLTVAGRGSANKAFTEIGAQDPDNYFQLYAKTFQGETKMVSIEQIGDKDGVFGNGWNDYSVFFTMPSIGEVTVGIRAASSGEGWVSATRFRLTRLGDPTVYLNENESFEGDLNFDALTWLFDGDEGTAPVDMLLHKNMQAGKWYSIAVPGDLPYDQIIREFGEGTLLAQPIGALDLDAEGKQKALTFYEWDPMESYGLGSDNIFGSPVDGMIANVPYLIKPAKVKASNRYLFKNIIATEKKSVENSEWSWGAISCSSDPDYVGYYWTSDDADVKFYPNYTYKPMFANGYTVEMCDTVKAFTGVFETEGAEIGTIVLLSVDEEGYLAFGDDAFDIPVQQILDLIALGQQKAGWYPGIPAAMTKKLTTVPELGTSVAEYVDAINALKSAIQEAQKAYEPSKKFNALMKQAEELLASDHTELVAGADAAFKKKIEQLQKRFDMQLKAEPINGLIEQLEEAIAEYKDQIYTGILETGKYILKNVATGKFFNGANSWGTRSSLVDHPEYMLLTKLDDGTYTLESRQNNGGEQFYFGPNYFVDNGTPMPLTFTVVGKGIYTITCNGESGVGLLGYDGSTSVLSGTLTDATSEDAQWLVYSEKDMAAMMAEASLENPVDVSFFIKDANFSRNHRDADAWIWETENHNIAGANENFCAESWTHTFVLSQEVELPNGVYMLNAQAALTDYTNAYDKRDDYPVVFAGDETVKFCEMEEADRATNMAQLSNSFLAGKYFVDPVIVKVTDGKLTIGAKCDATDYWCIFDNFSLTYFADADIDAVRAAYPKNTGATTGINEVNTGVNTGAIYNLNGVRVNNMTKKGVYIVNGKKFVVK
jgi:hypothetical protein